MRLGPLLLFCGKTIKPLDLGKNKCAGLDKITAAVCRLPPFMRPWPADWRSSAILIGLIVPDRPGVTRRCICKFLVAIEVIVLWRPALLQNLALSFCENVARCCAHSRLLGIALFAKRPILSEIHRVISPPGAACWCVAVAAVF